MTIPYQPLTNLFCMSARGIAPYILSCPPVHAFKGKSMPVLSILQARWNMPSIGPSQTRSHMLVIPNLLPIQAKQCRFPTNEGFIYLYIYSRIRNQTPSLMNITTHYLFGSCAIFQGYTIFVLIASQSIDINVQHALVLKPSLCQVHTIAP